MTLAQATKAQEANRLREAIDAISNTHRQPFAPAQKPLSPPPPLVDATQIRRQTATALKGIRLWNFSARKAAREEASVDAEVRIQDEVQRLRKQYDDYQRELDNWWSRLLANDPDVVIHRLAEAFEDNEAAAAPLGVDGSDATLVVLLPGEEVLPQRMPSKTPLGNVSLKKTTKRERDALYNQLAAGYTLVTVKEAFAVAPALDSIRIVAVRGTGVDGYGKKRGDALLAARIPRANIARVEWSADSPTILADISEELVTNQKGASKTLTPLDLAKEPELAQVVASIDFGELDD